MAALGTVTIAALSGGPSAVLGSVAIGAPVGAATLGTVTISGATLPVWYVKSAGVWVAADVYEKLAGVWNPPAAAGTYFDTYTETY